MKIYSNEYTRLKKYITKLKGDSKLFLLGINYSFQLKNTLNAFSESGIQIDGIVDDYYTNSEYETYKVIKMNELPQDAFVISMVTGTYLFTVLDKLSDLGINKTLSYWDLYLLDNIKFPTTKFHENNLKDINDNAELYFDLCDRLADEKSKIIFESVVNFRNTFDIDFLCSLNIGESNKQYYEDFIIEKDFDVFVDCGGFDGDTTKDFIKYNENYEKVYYFEPSPINMAKSKENLKAYKNVNYYQKGTYSHNATFNFSGNDGSSAAISETGENSIEVVPLDGLIEGENIFIKMDIEGAEIDTILGAKELIKNKKPALAICVYHEQNHFWKVPELISEIRNDYKIYLRHYSEGDLETVMYFI